MPPEWHQKIVATWFDPRVTRRSEKARDQLRDKADLDSRLTVPKFFLETRQHVGIKKILAICKDHFAVYEYKHPPLDKTGLVRIFDVSAEYVRLHRPYNVIQSFGNRDTSLCRYHMAFEFIYGAIWNWQKTIRDKKFVAADVGPMIHYGAYNFRRQLVCHPGWEKGADGQDVLDGDGNPIRLRYDKPECKAGTCDKCGELRLLVGDEDKEGLLTKAELDCKHEVNWQQWTKYICPVTNVEDRLSEHPD